MSKLSALVLVFAALAACAPDEQSAKLASQMSGRWAGRSAVPGEGEFQYLIERNTDGTYALHRVNLDGDRVIARSSESGKWFVQSETYKVKVESVNGRAVDARDLSNFQAYALGDIGADTIKLRFAGVEFTEKRVGAGYALP